jgi:hypothetical protein
MPTPRIIEQHEYISVVLGSRRLTTSYGGVKATGDVPRPVIDLWWGLCAGNRAKPEALARIGIQGETTNGEKIKAFVAHIDEIWPDWSVEIPAPTIGSTVMVDFGRKSGIDTGVVERIARNNAVVRFSRMGLVSVPFSMVRAPIPTETKVS